MSAAAEVFRHIAAAGIAGGGLYAFVKWNPPLPWKKEVRDRRTGAKWRRRVFKDHGR